MQHGGIVFSIGTGSRVSCPAKSQYHHNYKAYNGRSLVHFGAPLLKIIFLHALAHSFILSVVNLC